MEEIWLEDQRVQCAWDQYLRSRPVCGRCGEEILSNYALNLDYVWYCGDCVRSQTREVERT